VEVSSICPNGQVCCGVAGIITTNVPTPSVAAHRADHNRLRLVNLIGTSDLAADLDRNVDQHGLGVGAPAGESLCSHRLT
jgi:hypothetical protein